jgi:hypothetical protein
MTGFNFLDQGGASFDTNQLWTGVLRAMLKESQFTEKQIAFALRQVEAGVPADDLCRKPGVS